MGDDARLGHPPGLERERLRGIGGMWFASHLNVCNSLKDKMLS